MNEERVIADFQARLIELCDERDLPARGRQTQLAKEFGVVPNTARKWLLGEGLPELEMIIRIANWAEVNVLWLLQGIGPKKLSDVSVPAAALFDVLYELPSEAVREVLEFVRFKTADALNAQPGKVDRISKVLSATRLALAAGVPPMLHSPSTSRISAGLKLLAERIHAMADPDAQWAAFLEVNRALDAHLRAQVPHIVEQAARTAGPSAARPTKRKSSRPGAPRTLPDA